MGSGRPFAGKIFGIGLNKTGTTTLGGVSAGPRLSPPFL